MCSKNDNEMALFPDVFTHMSIRSGGMASMSDFRDLTPENLDGLWSQTQGEDASIEILFLSKRAGSQVSKQKAHRSALSIKWMAENLGVSPCFFDGVFHTTDSMALELPPLPTSELPVEETPLDDTLNGVYTTSLTDNWTTVWFSHQLDGMVSLYIIHNAEKDVGKNIAWCVGAGLDIPFLGIDALILDDERLFKEDYSKTYRDAREAIQKLNTTGSGAPPRRNLDGEGQIDIDHRYNAVFNIARAYSNKRAIVDLLKCLLKTRARLMADSGNRFSKYCRYSDGSWKSSIAQSTDLLRTVETTLANRENTVKNSMDLLKTLMSVRMAIYSAEITREAKKDSSSMTVVSLLTMFFLPGSFVASFFSTSFVQYSGTSKSLDTPDSKFLSPVRLVSGVWIFFMVTFILTACVFAVWIFSHGRHYYTIPDRFRVARKRGKVFNGPTQFIDLEDNR
ncbi:hypothetical protein BKA70DRAFT_1290009 [Coprinopsis sp. MPI-PUGE-AT-0042]|nr:hypothetical protein BKA70DRAFT_1290009 [Coprinopsis sp. MPI-PUGE-AT-0042]